MRYLLTFLLLLHANAQIGISEPSVSPTLKPFVEWWIERREYFDDFYKRIAGVANFSCPKIQNLDEKEITAHSLAPEQIKVIAALGDSLTAGLDVSARSHDELWIENRGITFPIGGDFSLEVAATLPNFVRYFSPDVKGASHWNETDSQHLNLAVSGSMSFDMAIQATRLLDRLKGMKGIDVQNDWKLVTIFIGTNDLFTICSSNGIRSSIFAKNMKQTVDYLKDHLPKTIVNIIPAFNIGRYRETLAYSQQCRELREGSCFNYKTIQEYQKVTDEFNSVYDYFLTNDSYQTDSFAVVVSDALNILNLFTFTDPNRLLLLAPDCFHFSAIANDIAAKLIWNSLMEPQKKAQANDGKIDPLKPIAIKCPSTECPYIRTMKNSAHCVSPSGNDQRSAVSKTHSNDFWISSIPYPPSMASSPATVIASIFVVVVMLLTFARGLKRSKRHDTPDAFPLMQRRNQTLVY